MWVLLHSAHSVCLSFSFPSLLSYVKLIICSEFKVAQRSTRSLNPDLRSQNIFTLGVNNNNSIRDVKAAARVAALAARSVTTVNTQQQTKMGAIDKPAMQRLLQAITALNQQQHQQLLNLQQQHTNNLTALTQVSQNAPVALIILLKVLQAKDLPQYPAQAYEDTLHVLTRTDMVGQIHQWEDVEKKNI